MVVTDFLLMTVSAQLREREWVLERETVEKYW
jgi:hypothetical protein